MIRTRRLSAVLAPLGHDLATRLKLPVLRELLGAAPPRPWADVGPGSGYATHQVFGPGSIIIVDVSAANLPARRLYSGLGFHEQRVRRSMLAAWVLHQRKWIFMRKDLTE